jgi:hypothetical protein
MLYVNNHLADKDFTATHDYTAAYELKPTSIKAPWAGRDKTLPATARPKPGRQGGGGEAVNDGRLGISYKGPWL